MAANDLDLDKLRMSVRRIAAECAYIDERGGVGIRLEPAAAIVRRYGDQFRQEARRKRSPSRFQQQHLVSELGAPEASNAARAPGPDQRLGSAEISNHRLAHGATNAAVLDNLKVGTLA